MSTVFVRSSYWKGRSLARLPTSLQRYFTVITCVAGVTQSSSDERDQRADASRRTCPVRTTGVVDGDDENVGAFAPTIEVGLGERVPEFVDPVGVPGHLDASSERYVDVVAFLRQRTVRDVTGGECPGPIGGAVDQIHDASVGDLGDHEWARRDPAIGIVSSDHHGVARGSEFIKCFDSIGCVHADEYPEVRRTNIGRACKDGVVANSMNAFEVTPTAEGWKITGEVDASTTLALTQAFGGELFEPGNRIVVLDVEDVTFMDSGGLRVLIQLSSKMGVGGITLRSPSRSVRRLLELAGLSDTFRLEDAVAD